MANVSSIINEIFSDDVQQTNLHIVGERLREIAAEHGLGVAVLVAWEHGQNIRHIPLKRDDAQRPLPVQATTRPADPYIFVNVPIRDIRGNNTELIRAGIMNDHADPTGLLLP
jgi:nitrogen fixation/metabolism regulation signal transduction histidine kinase